MRREITVYCLSLVLIALPALSAADDRFAAAAAKAERLDDLRTFLGHYVGSCTDPIERRACEANVAAFRKGAAAKTYVVRIPEAARLIRTQPKGERVVLLLTPFFDGGGYGLTRGQPRPNSSVDLVPMEVPLPPGTLEMDFLSPFRAGAIEVELVFRPERAWKLKRKGEPDFEGLAARFLSLRVLNARDGSEIAVRSW